MLSKNSVRKIILSRLKRLRDSTRLELQNSMLNSRLQSILNSRGGVWAGFMPLWNEPNLLETYKKLAGQIHFVFPRINGNEIHFFSPDGEPDFQKGPLGILEPKLENSKRVLASELTGVIVPGLGFDSKGSRLGRGMGFYDRFLKSCRAEKIGVCFQTQFSKEPLEVQEHDEKVNRLVTENLVLRFATLKHGIQASAFEQAENVTLHFARGMDLCAFSERNFL